MYASYDGEAGSKSESCPVKTMNPTPQFPHVRPRIAPAKTNRNDLLRTARNKAPHKRSAAFVLQDVKQRATTLPGREKITYLMKKKKQRVIRLTCLTLDFGPDRPMPCPAVFHPLGSLVTVFWPGYCYHQHRALQFAQGWYILLDQAG